ncbi:hypothetical protein CR513_22573, partial [Mucuna pruriens]
MIELHVKTKNLSPFALAGTTDLCTSVGYAECSQGYKFYDPTSRSFFETRNVRILEEVEFEKEENYLCGRIC